MSDSTGAAARSTADDAPGGPGDRQSGGYQACSPELLLLRRLAGPFAALRRTEERECGEFLTRRLVLAAYDDMAARVAG